MKIAIIPGDGIGKEVTGVALQVLDRLNEIMDLRLSYDLFDWGAERWLKDRVGLPKNALDMLANGYDSILFGALGDPRIPGMEHGREILLGLRSGLDLYVNFRPVIIQPLGSGSVDHQIDIYRENTQGLYQGIGGVVGGSRVDVAIDECVYTREKIEKFLRFSLSSIQNKGRKSVTLVHKSNAIPNTGSLWLSVFYDLKESYPRLLFKDEYVDSFCYKMIVAPDQIESVVTSNLFGDIVSDIGAALAGGLGLSASASLCPETGFGLFEPVHGSAPDIAGQGLANPIAMLRSLNLLLAHLGYSTAFNRLYPLLDEAAKRGTTEDGMVWKTQDCLEFFMSRLKA